MKWLQHPRLPFGNVLNIGAKMSCFPGSYQLVKKKKHNCIGSFFFFALVPGNHTKWNENEVVLYLNFWPPKASHRQNLLIRQVPLLHRVIKIQISLNTKLSVTCWKFSTLVNYSTCDECRMSRLCRCLYPNRVNELHVVRHWIIQAKLWSGRVWTDMSQLYCIFMT